MNENIPILIFAIQLYSIGFWKEVIHFWQAVTSKRFELQIWDWSWMKENSKIFENTLKKKFKNIFFSVLLWTNKKYSFFSLAFTVLTIYSLSFCHF